MGWKRRVSGNGLHSAPAKNAAAMPWQIAFTLGGLFLVSLVSGTLSFWGTNLVSGLTSAIIDKNVRSVHAANNLEIAMLEQRGLVASYLLDDGNTVWRDQLDARRLEFDRLLAEAKDSAHTFQETEILKQIERTYGNYTNSRQEAIALFDVGQRDQAISVQLRQVPQLYDATYRACEELNTVNVAFMAAAAQQIKAAARQSWWFTVAAISITAVLTGVLSLQLIGGVYRPLRNVTEEARRLSPGPTPDSSVRSETGDFSVLRHSINSLAEDAAQARLSFVKSRDDLDHSEKLASVGQNAVGVAHEIRSLLTTMKLWSFSLRDTRFDDENVQGTFETMHGELSRLEQLVRNFLEFARPPELNQTLCRLADVVRQAVILVNPRLVEKNLELEQHFDDALPPLLADSDQLKQVFVNLLTNACEASLVAGTVMIGAELERAVNDSVWIVVRMINNGHSIPLEKQLRILEPFVTTKSNGIGLGLSIAASIAKRHGGELRLVSSNDSGTEFALLLSPHMENHNGKDSAG